VPSGRAWSLPATMAHILDRIVATKKAEVEALRGRSSELESAAAAAAPPRDFRSALSGGPELAVIAEVKRRSPGAGPIRPDLSPAQLAGMYERGGAAALSVLTDREYFGGSLQDLRSARGSVGIAALRKDFTIDPLHVLEARANGADAILLIVRILSDTQLVQLRELAQGLGMAVLVEAHDGDEMDRALGSGADILGLNNRDLPDDAAGDARASGPPSPRRRRRLRKRDPNGRGRGAARGSGGGRRTRGGVAAEAGRPRCRCSGARGAHPSGSMRLRRPT